MCIESSCALVHAYSMHNCTRSILIRPGNGLPPLPPSTFVTYLLLNIQSVDTMSFTVGLNRSMGTNKPMTVLEPDVAAMSVFMTTPPPPFRPIGVLPNFWVFMASWVYIHTIIKPA